MPENARNPEVDAYFDRIESWREECEHLRAMVLERDLTEDLKWGEPCYTHGGKNVLIIHGFKDYCALLFFNGAVLKDPNGILVQQTKNVQAARQIRFTALGEITQLEPILKTYIDEAIAAEKAGLKIEYKRTEDFPVPDELQARFDSDPTFNSAFSALTPGRQRAYLLHFAEAKQSKTREARIDKYRPKILDGKGMHD